MLQYINTEGKLRGKAIYLRKPTEAHSEVEKIMDISKEADQVSKWE